MTELFVQCLELMNRAFITPGDTAAAQREFYHQYRKLWDRGIPVKMGLGHVLLRSGPAGLQFVQVLDSREEVPLDPVTFLADGTAFLVKVGGSLYTYDLGTGRCHPAE